MKLLICRVGKGGLAQTPFCGVCDLPKGPVGQWAGGAAADFGCPSGVSQTSNAKVCASPRQAALEYLRKAGYPQVR